MSVKPTASESNLTSVVVGVPKYMELIGTFGVSDSDAARWVGNTATDCENEEDVDYRATAKVLRTVRGTSRNSTYLLGSSYLEVSSSIAIGDAQPLKLCYR